MTDKKMWFGQEPHFQWVPCPAYGLQVSRTSRQDSLEYDSGGLAVNRTNRFRKTYEMEFPASEASGNEGLDVFAKYASGFYGDTTEYPIYLADPMNYRENLMPEHWASPGLVFQGWPRIVEGRERYIYNLVKNSSLEYPLSSGTWEGILNGTDNGRVTDGPATGAYGDYVYKVTATGSHSSGTFGVTYNVSQSTGLRENTQYTFAFYAKCSVSRNIELEINWRGDSGSISSITYDKTVAADTWELLSIEGATSPAGTTYALIYISGGRIGPASNWGNGNTLRVDAGLIHRTLEYNSGYFDGDFEDAAWLGDADSNYSERYLKAIPPDAVNTSPNTLGINTVRAVYSVQTPPGLVPLYGSDYMDQPYALIPIPAGYTLWLGATGDSPVGDAYLGATSFDSDGEVVESVTVEPQGETGGYELTESLSSVSGATYAKVYISRSSSLEESIISLSSITAQLWPTGSTPDPITSFIPGLGHTGLSFTDTATVENYTMFDPYRNTPTRLKGLSTSLIEVSPE